MVVFKIIFAGSIPATSVITPTPQLDKINFFFKKPNSSDASFLIREDLYFFFNQNRLKSLQKFYQNLNHYFIKTKFHFNIEPSKRAFKILIKKSENFNPTFLRFINYKLKNFITKMRLIFQINKIKRLSKSPLFVNFIFNKLLFLNFNLFLNKKSQINFFLFKLIQRSEFFIRIKKYKLDFILNWDYFENNICYFLIKKYNQFVYSKKQKTWKDMINTSSFNKNKIGIVNPKFEFNSNLCIHFYSKLDFLIKILYNPHIFKIFFTQFDYRYLFLNFATNFVYKNNFFFFKSFRFCENLIPQPGFRYFLIQKLLILVAIKKFEPDLMIWYNTTLIRFLENIFGKKAFVQIYSFLNTILTQEELIRCLMWSQKLKHFKKVIGSGLFLVEAVKIIYIGFKIKDPYFLINWMKQTLQKINFWKLRTFFYFIRYLLRYFFLPLFDEFGVKGIKFRLKGKISVAGNSRTRSVVHIIGKTSQSSFSNKIIQVSELIGTFTGVMGFRIWLIF